MGKGRRSRSSGRWSWISGSRGAGRSTVSRASVRMFMEELKG